MEISSYTGPNSFPEKKKRAVRWVFVSAATLIFLGGIFGVWAWHRHVVNERAVQAELSRHVQAEQLSVTIPEGLSMLETFSRLENKKLGTQNSFELAAKQLNRGDYTFLSSVPKAASLEGFLFPETYRFHTTATSLEIIETLLKEFDSQWSRALDGGSSLGDQKIKISQYEKLPALSVYELVTLASIIEKETGRSGEGASSLRLAEERQTVAGVFYNRLVKGQPLESDATINYITKGGRPAPTSKDLSVESAYNTYKNAGLPPGPICNPSYSSLYAVLHPIKTDYYFFLHKQPSGEVVYSKTYAEHLEKKYKFLK